MGKLQAGSPSTLQGKLAFCAVKSQSSPSPYTPSLSCLCESSIRDTSASQPSLHRKITGFCLKNTAAKVPLQNGNTRSSGAVDIFQSSPDGANVQLDSRTNSPPHPLRFSKGDRGHGLACVPEQAFQINRVVDTPIHQIRKRRCEVTRWAGCWQSGSCGPHPGFLFLSWRGSGLGEKSAGLWRQPPRRVPPPASAPRTGPLSSCSYITDHISTSGPAGMKYS